MRPLPLLPLLLALAAPAPAAVAAPPAPAAAPPAMSPVARQPLLVVDKSPSCGCCAGWVTHMRQAGFAVEVHDADDLAPLKRRLGVPAGKASCHTARVGGYFIEGHVPAADVRRLLAERPDALGLTAPGMPMGSPGMETPDGRTPPYVVELVHRDGRTTVFARHGGPAR